MALNGNEILQVTGAVNGMPCGVTETVTTGEISGLAGSSIVQAPATLIANTQNIVPSRVFNRWRPALNNARSGVSNARILCVSDSTGAGIGTSLSTTFPSQKSYPSRLAQLMNSTVTPTSIGLGIPPSIFSGNADNRWTVGTGWTTGPTFGWAGGSDYTCAAAPAQPLVFTQSLQVNCNAFYVYYLTAPGLANILATATGGSQTTINANLPSGVSRSLVMAGSASTSNALSISASGSVHIIGVEPVLTTATQVLVGNAGVAASTSGNWAVGGSSPFNGIPCIKAYAPDLMIISLGINDAANNIMPPALESNLQFLITAGQISGDVLLCDFPPSSGVSAPLEPSYLPVYSALAAANNCAYLSEYNRLGGAYNAAYMSGGTDPDHPSDAGYFDWAQFIYNVIANP